MKRLWIPIAVFTTVGIISVLAFGAVSIANKVDYEVLSYQVQYLDSEGVTFRVMFGVTNPSGMNLDVSNQNYEIFVAGYKISDVTSKESYRLIAGNTSVIPLDVHLKWEDINSKLSPINSQSSVSSIGDLPVVIKGKLTARLGIIRISNFPVRTSMRLGVFLP